MALLNEQKLQTYDLNTVPVADRGPNFDVERQNEPTPVAPCKFLQSRSNPQIIVPYTNQRAALPEVWMPISAETVASLPAYRHYLNDTPVTMPDSAALEQKIESQETTNKYLKQRLERLKSVEDENIRMAAAVRAQEETLKLSGSVLTQQPVPTAAPLVQEPPFVAKIEPRSDDIPQPQIAPAVEKKLAALNAASLGAMPAAPTMPVAPMPAVPTMAVVPEATGILEEALANGTLIQKGRNFMLPGPSPQQIIARSKVDATTWLTENTGK